MAELHVGATPRELVPGDPDEIDALVGRMAVLGDGLSAAGAQLRAIEAGEWVGQAADAFRSVVGQEPDKYENAGSAFSTAASAIRGYTGALREAQGRAQQAISLYEQAEAQTQRWRGQVARYESAQRSARASNDPEVMARADAMPSPGGDPGADERSEAQGMLAAAREEVRSEGRRVAGILEAEWQDAPNEPGMFDRMLGWGGEFLGGIWDATWGTVEFLWSISTIRMMIDPEGWHRDMTALAQGIVYGITHPVEFGKAILDWDTWRENPARALGRLVPDLILTLATAGGGAAARGSRGLAALRRLGGRADDVADVARLSNRAEDLGDIARWGDNIPDHLGPSRVPSEGRVGRLADGYEPMGGRSPEDFVRRHWDPNAGRHGNGGWASGRGDGTGYPPDDGFVPGTRLDYSPRPGEVIDRFGHPGGRYTSPEGIPLRERGLPPDSLDPFEPDFGYRRYRVNRWDDGYLTEVPDTSLRVPTPPPGTFRAGTVANEQLESAGAPPSEGS